MNRQITFTAEKDSGKKQAETYYSKLLKLIPAETVAVYLFIDGVIKSSLGQNATQMQWWLWISLIIIAIGNVYYLNRTLNVTDRVQYSLMTVAFIVWIFTIGGPFALFSWYQPFMGSVILALFTFAAPAIYDGTEV